MFEHSRTGEHALVLEREREHGQRRLVADVELRDAVGVPRVVHPGELAKVPETAG